MCALIYFFIFLPAVCAPLRISTVMQSGLSSGLERFISPLSLGGTVHQKVKATPEGPFL